MDETTDMSTGVGLGETEGIVCTTEGVEPQI